ncbi:MAG: SRPBCC domain-containing protein [Leptospiraceae bacterium]|nr:SRPBCC domain-containing protein [Leptospiraceae bacterium]
MEIRTEIEINAPAEAVYKVLVNFPDYASWNPVITKINGMPYVGEKISFNIKAAPSVEIPIPSCEILVANASAKELRWKGPAIPIASDILSGEHYFIAQEISPQKTRFVHGENFTGLAAGALKPLLQDRLTESYNEMNRALKTRCER